MFQSCKRISLHYTMVTLILVLIACSGNGSIDEAAEPDNASPSIDQSTHPAESSVRSVDDNADLDADGDGFMNLGEYKQAVQVAFEDYQWPEDYTPTVPVMLTSLDNAPPGEHFFQVGMERTKLGSWHQCAWYLAWHDAFQSGDSAGQAEALQVMTDILPNRSTIDPSGVQVLSQIAETAALGDPSEVISMIEGLRCNDLSFG